MRRRTLRSLVALLVVALLATGLIAPRGALAAPSSVRGLPAPSKDLSPATTFKGRVVAKNNPTNYFVLTFACSGGTLTAADWTYEVNSTQSFTGTIGTPAPVCALVSTTNGVTYSTPTSIPLMFNGKNVTGTLKTLSFTNIVASKTYFGNPVAISSTMTTEDCTSLAATSCVEVQTDALTLTFPTTPSTTVTVAGFKLGGTSTSTLNLSEK